VKLGRLTGRPRARTIDAGVVKRRAASFVRAVPSSCSRAADALTVALTIKVDGGERGGAQGCGSGRGKVETSAPKGTINPEPEGLTGS